MSKNQARREPHRPFENDPTPPTHWQPWLVVLPNTGANPDQAMYLPEEGRAGFVRRQFFRNAAQKFNFHLVAVEPASHRVVMRRFVKLPGRRND